MFGTRQRENHFNTSGENACSRLRAPFSTPTNGFREVMNDHVGHRETQTDQHVCSKAFAMLFMAFVECMNSNEQIGGFAVCGCAVN